MDASLLFLSPQGFGPDRVAGRGTDLGAGATPEAPGLFARALSDATEAGSEPAPVPALAAGATGATDQGAALANLPMPVSLPMSTQIQMQTQMQLPLAMPSSASALATSPTAGPPQAAPIGPGTQLPGPGASAAAAHRVALADVAGVIDDVVSAVLPEPSSPTSPSSPVEDDQETGATSGPDMALMQWMLQMVPQAPVPTAPTAPPTPVAEPSSARPGLQQGAAPPLAMLAAGLSGRPEPGGRDGPAPRDAGRGGSAPVAGTAGVLTRAAGLATLKTMALPDAEVRRADSPARAPVAGVTPAAALAPSRTEPVTSNALSGWSASTADTQALSPAAAQAAAAAAATAPTTVAASAGSPVSPPAQAWIRTPVTQPGFTNEVVVALVRDVSQSEPGSHALTLHLNPESLGPVSVSIEMQGSTARIEFSASEALTRQHLESALPELHQALQDHGVSLTQSGVHEASKESLAASAAGSQTSGGAGSDARQRGEAPFDGRSGYGERAPRWETEVFSVDGSAMADSNARAQASRGPSPGRAGRLDLFA